MKKLFLIISASVLLVGASCSVATKQPAPASVPSKGAATSQTAAPQTTVQPNQGTPVVDCAFKGQFLVQVQLKSEVWYVNPADCKRYSFGSAISLADIRPLISTVAGHINQNDINRIPIGILANGGTHMDSDGLDDTIEDAIGTDKYKVDTDGDGYDDFTEVRNNHNPLGAGDMPIDMAFADMQKGKIFVIGTNPAWLWYVSPRDSHRYVLGRLENFVYPGEYSLMRDIGTEVADDELMTVPLGAIAGESTPLVLNSGKASVSVTLSPAHPVPGGEVTFTIDVQGLATGEKVNLVMIAGPEVLETLEKPPYQKTILLPYAAVGVQKYLVNVMTTASALTQDVSFDLQPNSALKKIVLKSPEDYLTINQVLPFSYSPRDFTMQAQVEVNGEFESNATSNLLALLPSGDVKITTTPAGVLRWVNQGNFINVEPLKQGKATFRVEYQGKSAELDFTVLSSNHRPVAVIMPPIPRTLKSGATVTLDAKDSYDPDGNPITYQWTISRVSTGVITPIIVNSSSAIASFVAPTAGEYDFSLTVDDSKSQLAKPSTNGYGEVLNSAGYNSSYFTGGPDTAQSFVTIK